MLLLRFKHILLMYYWQGIFKSCAIFLNINGCSYTVTVGVALELVSLMHFLPPETQKMVSLLLEGQ